MSKNESFIRWQGRSIEEFGRTLNFILTINIASFGYILNKLICGVEVKLYYEKLLVIFSLLSFILSILLGIICMLLRMNNIRLIITGSLS